MAVSSYRVLAYDSKFYNPSPAFWVGAFPNIMGDVALAITANGTAVVRRNSNLAATTAITPAFTTLSIVVLTGSSGPQFSLKYPPQFLPKLKLITSK